jgi:hypothetical protein
MVARLAGDARVSPGQRLSLAVARGDVHVFDAESGERREV